MFLLDLTIGYGIINVVCERPERFINRLFAEGTSLYNVERTGRNSFTAVVRRRDLKPVSAMAEEYGAEFRILKTGGAAALIRRFRNRTVLLITLVSALIALFILSGRILLIETEGADWILTEAVNVLLAEEGISAGTSKRRVDTKTLSEKLTLIDPSISNAIVHTEGVILRIRLLSAEELDRTQQDLPCSIYADKDCVIRKIAVFDGKAAVSVGDAVRKDQLLVSGAITSEGFEMILVPSDAVIIGEAAYRFEVTVEGKVLRPVRSGKSVEFTRLSVFGAVIDPQMPFVDYEDEAISYRAVDASILPLKAIRCKAWELVLRNVSLSKDEMLTEALRLTDEKMRFDIPKQARIISKTTDLVWNEDGSLTAAVTVHTIENIGYLRYL